MPQMKPIFWLNLYISFSLIIMIYMIMNFYNFLNLNMKNNLILNNSIKNMNWKW